MPTIFIFHDDTHAFARGVKIERVQQSVFPHLTLEGDLQQTAVGPMEHYTIPGRENCCFIWTIITNLFVVIIDVCL